jgi:hypothetical protein
MAPTSSSTSCYEASTNTIVGDKDVEGQNQQLCLSFSTALEESMKARRRTGQTPTSSLMMNGKVALERTARRCVSFPNDDCGSNQLTVVHPIESLDDYTEEEHTQTWFSRREYDDIKASYSYLIHRMRNKEQIAETEITSTRGLEGRSRAGAKARREVQTKSMVSVLAEQQRQRVEGRTDPEALAIVYRQFAYHSLQAAVNMGRRDAHAVASNFELDGLDERRPSSVGSPLDLAVRASASNPHSSVPHGSSVASFRPRGGLNLGLQHQQQQQQQPVRVPTSGTGMPAARRAVIRTAGHRRAAAA